MMFQLQNSQFHDASLKVTAVLLFAAVFCWLIRHSSAALRHRVWVTAAFASLLIPIGIASLPKISLPVLPAGPTMAIASMDSTLTPNPKMDGNGDPKNIESKLKQIESPKQSNPDALVTSTSGTPSSAIRLPATGISTGTLARSKWNPLLILWLVGASVVAIPYVYSLVIQRLRKRQLLEIKEERWCEGVLQLSDELGLQRHVRTYESDRQIVPSVFGVLNPYVVVPSNWADWSEPQRRCVLLHELAHVKRWDVATQFVGRLMAVVYWFNPLVWYAKRQLRIERELACDDCVLLTGQKASEYAQQLLHTLRLYRTERLTAGVAIAGSARLDGRVVAILDQQRSRQPIGKLAASIGILCAAVMTIALATVSLAAKPQVVETPSPQTRSPQTDETKNAVAQHKANRNQPGASEPAIGKLLGLIRRENGKLVMWKADGSPTQSLPVPSELPDEQPICVFEIDPVGELMGFDCQLVSCNEVWRSSENRSIAFASLFIPRGRKYGHINLTLAKPVRQEVFFPLKQGDVGKTIDVQKHGIAKFLQLGPVKENSFRVSVAADMKFVPDRLVAVSRDGSLHMGTRGEPEYSDNGEVDIYPMTYPIPLGKLAGLAIAELKTESLRFSNAAMQPGVQGSGRRIHRPSVSYQPRKLPALEQHTRRFVLEDDLAVDLVAVGKLAENGLEWWSPDGSARIKLDDVYEADVEGMGTVVAVRSSGYAVTGSAILGNRHNSHYAAPANLWIYSVAPIRRGFGDGRAGFGDDREEGSGSLNLQVIGTKEAIIESHGVDPSDMSIQLSGNEIITAAESPITEPVRGTSNLTLSFKIRQGVGFAVRDRAGKIVHQTGGMGAGGGPKSDPNKWKWSMKFPIAPQDIRELLVIQVPVFGVTIDNIPLQSGRKTALKSTVQRTWYTEE